MNPFIKNCPSPSYFLAYEDTTPSVEDVSPTRINGQIARRINDSIEPSHSKCDPATLLALDAFMEEIETTSGMTHHFNEEHLQSIESYFRRQGHQNVKSEESKFPDEQFQTPMAPYSNEVHEEYVDDQVKDEEDVIPEATPTKDSSRVLRKRKLDPEYEDDVPKEAHIGKKQVKTGKTRQRCGMVQNYKGVTSRGWARVLDDPFDSIDNGLYQELFDLVSAKWESDMSLRKKFAEVEDFFNEVLKYVRNKIRGKVIKKSGNNKESEDSKVGNAKKIQEVFYSGPGDSEVDKTIKEILRNHFSYFFDSKYYFEWLFEDCRADDSNKSFLLINAKEFKQVFSKKDHRPNFHNVDVPLSQVLNLIKGLLCAGAAAACAEESKCF